MKQSLNMAIHDAILAVAYRHVNISPPSARAVVAFAESQVGRGYDVSGIMGQAGYQLDRWFLCTLQNVRNCEARAARNNLWMQSNSRFFCSELVAEAYRRADVSIINATPSRVSPQTIVEVVSTGLLAYVGHLKA